MTPLAGHTGSYYSYSFEQACAGLAEAGYRAVELSAVPGATEHVDVHGDPAEVRARLDHFGHPAVAVNYDTANVEYYGGVRAEHDLPAIADRVANVHLKDMRGAQGEWDFPAIAQGHVDFGRVIEILRGAGFEGPYSVEVEFTGGVPWPPLDEVNAAMRASRQALAEHGLS
jgi:L-ribulose-5-phosphate 3-epimerase